MNDNTIIRIKVPARLYESVKARLMIKENYEAPVEETETLEESPIVDVITALSGVLGLGLTGVAISKAQDLLKKKNPELFDKLQSAGASMKNQGAGLNEAKKVDPKKAAEDKKKKEVEAKKKEAEAKKVADKKAADKKKAAEKKK
jgi:hypothetical protein